jgi:hypothetical protein
MTLLYTIGFENLESDEQDILTLPDTNLNVNQIKVVLSEIQNKL